MTESDVDDDEDDAIAGPPPAIAEPLASCMEFVHRAVGVELDLTSATLPILDHYVDGAREELTRRPELRPLLARAVGAYFGEALRLAMDGFWSIPGQDVHEWRVCSGLVYLWVNPVGMAYDALSSGSDHDGPASDLGLAPEDRTLVRARLDLLPEVPEDEYYRLATRWDAVEIAVAALRDQMLAAGTADVRFEPADYED